MKYKYTFANAIYRCILKINYKKIVRLNEQADFTNNMYDITVRVQHMFVV